MTEPRVTKLPGNLRPGSGAHERWDRARLGMTVSELLEAGVLPRDIPWYARRGGLVFFPPLRRAPTPTDPTEDRSRPCLCCGQTFNSEGPHNRLCGPCRGRGGNPFEPD